MKKIKLFLRKIIKSQFLLQHIVIFILFPITLSLLMTGKQVLYGIDGEFLSGMVTIIGITGGLLLNFLAIILTSNSTILTTIKDNYGKDNIYGEINLGTKKIQNIKRINFYYLMYYRIFFLIFLSLLFIISYIFVFAGIGDLLNFFDKLLYENIKNILNSTFHLIFEFGLLRILLLFLYNLLISLYFILLTHLIYRLYYLFHNSNSLS